MGDAIRPKTAAGGGLLRDWYGIWNGGFSICLGACAVEEAELWAVIHGLRLVWEKNIRVLTVEVNSL